MSITKKIASQISNTLNFIDDFYLSVDSATNGIKLEDGDAYYARYIQLDNANNKISLIDGNLGIDLNIASGGGVAAIKLIAHSTDNFVMLEQGGIQKITIKNSRNGILIDGSNGSGIVINAQSGGLRVDATNGSGFITTIGSSNGFQVLDNGTGGAGFVVNLTGAAPIDIKTNGAALNLSTVAPGNAPINIGSSGDINIRTTDTTTKQVLIAAGINSAYDGYIYLKGKVIIDRLSGQISMVGNYDDTDSPISISVAGAILIYNCDTTNNPITVNLPEIDGSVVVQGQTFTIKNSKGPNVITLNAFAGETIDGSASQTLTQNESLTLVAIVDAGGNYWAVI